MNKLKAKLLLMSLLTIQATAYGDINNFLSPEFNKTVYSWLNEDTGPAETLNKIDLLELEIDKEEMNLQTYYWKSKISLIRGQVYYALEMDRESENQMESSISMAEKSMNYGEYSDGWRLQADAGSYLMLFKGVGYIIANLEKIQANAKRALELDPGNVRASLIIAQRLIKAPALFGGNKKNGLLILENINEREDISKEDRYYIMLALSEVYKSSKREQDALKIYHSLLAIYPGSSFIKELILEME